MCGKSIFLFFIIFSSLTFEVYCNSDRASKLAELRKELENVQSGLQKVRIADKALLDLEPESVEKKDSRSSKDKDSKI